MNIEILLTCGRAPVDSHDGDVLQKYQIGRDLKYNRDVHQQPTSYCNTPKAYLFDLTCSETNNQKSTLPGDALQTGYKETLDIDSSVKLERRLYAESQIGLTTGS